MRHALLGLLILTGCSSAPVTPAPPPSAVRAGLEIEPVSGLGLFADERARSRVLISQAIAARDAGVLPFEVIDRAWALAAEGRNPLDGAACGKRLVEYQARKRWGAALGVTGTVGSNVWCAKDGGCELSVYGRPLDDDAEARFHLVAPLPLEGDALEALASATARLAPPPASEGGGMGLLGGLGGAQPIQEEDRLEVRVWPADHRDRTKLADEANALPSLTLAQVQTCTSGNDTHLRVLIEVSATGAITRCEGDESDEPAASSCLCGQLQRGAAAPALFGKRWSMSASIDRKDQLTSDRRFVLTGWWNTYLQRVKGEAEKFPRYRPKVEDPSIDDWSPGSARLAAGCFANAFTGPGKFDSRWAVWFDGAGRPTKVLEQKGFPPLPKELADCVVRALKTSQSPCPSRAGLWAMADLHVNARDPNAAPLSGLKELFEKKP